MSSDPPGLDLTIINALYLLTQDILATATTGTVIDKVTALRLCLARARLTPPTEIT